MAKKAKKPDSISTFIGPEASVEGVLEFQGTIRLDGNLKGKIVSEDGTVVVGENAKVSADISVGTAIVMGEVVGTIDAVERIEVYPPGRIVGDIQSPLISIEEGGKLNGSCTMKEGMQIAKKRPRESENSPVSPDSAS